MKDLRWIFLPVVLVALFIFAPAMSFSQEENIGDYVSVVAPKGPNAEIAPGHYGIIATYAASHLAEAYSMGYRNITWQVMYQNGFEKYFIVDTRQVGQYCAGHLPGAVNIPYQYAAGPSNLALLPMDMPIVVVCVTGQTASQVMAIYNMLGYNAYNLRGGMSQPGGDPIPIDLLETCVP
jgi:rhodanese-related sulfurtransferase